MTRVTARLVCLLSASALCCGCAAVPATPLTPPSAPAPTQAANSTVVNVTAPGDSCCPPPSLWDLLGVKQIFGAGQTLGTRIRSRLGMRFPGLEPRPAVAPITDPSNQSPTSPPANKAAAQIKADQDAAGGTIKALRFLATVGCGGCHPDVEAAFLAALDDCTEAVRYEAVKGLSSTMGNACAYCRTGNCCSPKIREKLEKIAHDRDQAGCPKEPSDRIRRIARLALNACAAPDVVPAPTEGPPAQDQPPAGAPPAVAPIAGVTPANAPVATATTASLSQAKSPAPATREEPPASRNAIPVAAPPYRCRSCGNPALGQLGTGQEHLVASSDQSEAVGSGELKTDTQVSRQQLFAHYRAKLDQYREPWLVRWEQLLAPAASFSSRDEARAALDYLRNEMLGQPEHAVAPPRLQAVQERRLDWMRPEEADSTVIAELLHRLPVGRASHIVEDAAGFRLIRVIERRGGRARPLDEVAEWVEADILEQRREEAARNDVHARHPNPPLHPNPVVQTSSVVQTGLEGPPPGTELPVREAIYPLPPMQRVP